MMVQELLGCHFCESYHISLTGEYELEWIDAKELLTYNRIDLIAKYKYVEFLDKGYDMTFATELYFEHIKAFSSGSFVEPGQESTKNNFESYLSSFHSLIIAIKNNFDPRVSAIPLGKNNIILDGSHRVSITAYYDKKVPVIRFPEIEVEYGFDFFQSQGLNVFYLDYLALEYCKLKDGVIAACIWPIANAPDRTRMTESLLRENARIVYKKVIDLSFSALCNLFVEVYSGAQWLGTPEDGFRGAQAYASRCFSPKGKLIVYLLEGITPENILLLKEAIRNIWQIGNESIHTTDNKSETVRLVNLLLNENSLHLLRYGRPFKYTNTYRQLECFKHELKDHNLLSEDFIVDSSSVLALYGLREACDIDYLTICDNIANTLVSAESHNEYVDLYETTVSDLIMNPHNYMYNLELKFITPVKLKLFKSNRSEIKDLYDVELIDSLLSQNTSFEVVFWKISAYLRQKKSRFFFCVVAMVKKHPLIFKYPLKVYRCLRYGKNDSERL